MKERPPVFIDGAHNPQAAAVLAAYLKKALDLYSRIILVMGIMADKDREGIMLPLLPLASEIIFTASKGSDSSLTCSDDRVWSAHHYGPAGEL